jgi:hypothetical protein
VEHENVGLDVDDAMISLGLAIGSLSEQQEALRFAWTKYRKRVASFIYHHAPGLSPDCVAALEPEQALMRSPQTIPTPLVDP